MIFPYHRSILLLCLSLLALPALQADDPHGATEIRLRSQPHFRTPRSRNSVPQKQAEVYWVPYRLSDVKHVVVRIKINGKGPFNFIVDTGAPAVYIGTAVAKELGINIDGKEGDHTFDSFEVEG